ncbi:zinc ABC transporter substrate-binding protein [bacterium]|nr:zinc ABC transporter substrate-binding protein [bacterium]
MSGVRIDQTTTILLSLLAFAWVSCLNQYASSQEPAGEKKVVVCSTTQVADFTRNVVGDRWKVICVLAPAEDPHTYETLPEDAANVTNADLCLDNGWNLEGRDWMRGMADAAGKPIHSCIEGVQALELQDHDQTIKDPHAWFSPANAAIYIDNIVKAVSSVDPDNAMEYKARAMLYKTQLVALDNWIQRQLSTLPSNQRVLISHHDAFGYFCARYQFKSFSPFGWTTAELTDLGVDQRQKVVESIRDLAVKAIFVETTIDEKTIKLVAREAGVVIGGKLYSDAMGTKNSAGETYIGMMRENVLTIVQSLK